MEITQVARVLVVLLSILSIVLTFVKKRRMEKRTGGKVKLTKLQIMFLVIDVSCILFLSYMFYINSK